MTQKEKIRELTDKFLLDIKEYSDCVQVFISWESENKSTKSMVDGAGNYYARLGLVREFILSDDERTRVEIRVEKD